MDGARSEILELLCGFLVSVRMYVGKDGVADTICGDAMENTTFVDATNRIQQSPCTRTVQRT